LIAPGVTGGEVALHIGFLDEALAVGIDKALDIIV
jgi:hypothetical protein